jgi:hypothetical protein
VKLNLGSQRKGKGKKVMKNGVGFGIILAGILIGLAGAALERIEPVTVASVAEKFSGISAERGGGARKLYLAGARGGSK